MYGSEGRKLDARLALTGRYMSCQLPGLDQSRLKAVIASLSLHSAADAWHRQTDFKATPPGPILVDFTLRLLESIAADECISAIKHTTLTSTMRALFHQRLDAQQLELLEASESSEESDFSSGASDETSVGWARLESFVSRLSQQSLGSWQAEANCKALRSCHMNDFAASQLDIVQLPLHQPACRDAAVDAYHLVQSNDFPVMVLGLGSRCNGHLSEQEEGDCTVAFLRIRIILRSEPFYVQCSGTAHMAAFLELAKWSELHLQLLPSHSQLQHISK